MDPKRAEFDFDRGYDLTIGCRNRVYIGKDKNGNLIYEDLGSGLAKDGPERGPNYNWAHRRPYRYRKRECRWCHKMVKMGPRCKICPDCRKHNVVYKAQEAAKIKGYHKISAFNYRQKLLSQGWQPQSYYERAAKPREIYNQKYLDSFKPNI